MFPGKDRANIYCILCCCVISSECEVEEGKGDMELQYCVDEVFALESEAVVRHPVSPVLRCCSSK